MAEFTCITQEGSVDRFWEPQTKALQVGPNRIFQLHKFVDSPCLCGNFSSSSVKRIT